MKLRRATVADLALLVRHRRRMWEDIGGRTRAALDRADPVYRAWVLREMDARRFAAYLVEDRRGLALGSGAVWLVPAQPRPAPLDRLEMPYILSMYTVPSARRKGIASRIVGALVRWARVRGYVRVTLHASRGGRPVYERLGFEAGGEMRLDLPRRRRARRTRPPGRSTGRGRRSSRSG